MAEKRGIRSFFAKVSSCVTANTPSSPVASTSATPDEAHVKEEPKWNFVRLCMCYYYISLHNNREIYVQNASTS